MTYTEEEAAILCGFIGRYLDRATVCEPVRVGYSRLCKGLEQNTFDPSGLPMDGTGAAIPNAPMVGRARRSPCIGIAFAENTDIDSDNKIISTGRIAV